MGKVMAIVDSEEKEKAHLDVTLQDRLMLHVFTAFQQEMECRTH